MRENGEIDSDDHKVCHIFNTFFVNIGSDIGMAENNDRPLQEILDDHKRHESLALVLGEIIEVHLHSGL